MSKICRQLAYRGLDMRLGYKEKYNVSVYNDGYGGYGVVVHMGPFRNIRKYYDSREGFEREWSTS